MTTSREFRLSIKQLYWGSFVIFFGVVFSVISLIGAVLGHGDPEPLPPWSAAIFGVFALMGLYLVVAQRRTRIRIENDWLHAQFMFTNRAIELPKVKVAVWRTVPRAGSVKLTAANESVVVSLSEFDKADEFELIRLIRKGVPEERQQDWPRFCHQIAMPLREGWPSRLIMDAPESKRILTTRRRWDIFFGVLLVISTGIAAAFFLMGRDSTAVGLPLAVLGFWLLIRFSVPKQGRWDLRLTSTKESCEMAVWVLLMPLLATVYGLMRGLDLIESVSSIMLVAFAVGVMMRMLWIARRMDKQRASRDREQSPSSVAAWNELEAIGPV